MDSRTGAVARGELPPLASSVSEARRLLRHHLVAAGGAWAERADDAELLVSEVVTNAVVHAATPIDVTITAGRSGLRVEVGDGSPHLPAVRSYAAMSGTGRGLRMLEQLADAWGAEARGEGKVVWFELGRFSPATARRPAAASPTVRAAGTEGRMVRLLRVPLLLHSAWQAHAAALLREYLLVRLDEEDAMAAVEAHAAANDAMSLLREQIPAPGLRSDPAALMVDATEPGVTAEVVLVRVPAASLPHFELLDRDLDASSALADGGRLLTAPTQPEVRQLRRWLVREVLEQSSGREPRPLDLEIADTGRRDRLPSVLPSSPPGASPLDHLGHVTHAADAVLAADEVSRIVAVSAPALALLGHGGRDALVGRRVLAIIPPRYRQAHLAGFTLHLTEGRGPLLDAPVVVPALRGDGTEITLRLTVTAERLPDGRRVFVARFERL